MSMNPDAAQLQVTLAARRADFISPRYYPLQPKRRATEAEEGPVTPVELNGAPFAYIKTNTDTDIRLRHANDWLEEVDDGIFIDVPREPSEAEMCSNSTNSIP